MHLSECVSPSDCKSACQIKEIKCKKGEQDVKTSKQKTRWSWCVATGSALVSRDGSGRSAVHGALRADWGSAVTLPSLLSALLCHVL